MTPTSFPSCPGLFTAALLFFLVPTGGSAAEPAPGPPAAVTAPAAPPRPAEYRVTARYRISAGRTQRLLQLQRLEAFLDRIGFDYEPVEGFDRENPEHVRLSGTIAGGNARYLLENPVIRSLLLVPAGANLPDPEKPVLVGIELTPGLTPTSQRLLHEQVGRQIAGFGFRQRVGYDHRGFTRLVGTIPAGELTTLLKDVRQEPSGWLAPDRPVADLPAPLRTRSPILVTEVLDVDPPVKEASAPEPPPADKEYLGKISADLSAVIAQAEAAKKPARFEVILTSTPTREDRRWAAAFDQVAPEVAVEGRLGQLLTVFGPPAAAPALAALPEVSTLRLPRPGVAVVIPSKNTPDREAVLRASGLKHLHDLGRKGQGVRIAVVGPDFRGYQAAVKAGKLPAGTALIDLTAERSYDLLPDPSPEDGPDAPVGLLCAEAVALAAPEAALTLIRIDPSAPYMLDTVARSINGEVVVTEAMRQRDADIEAEESRLEKTRAELLEERREAVDSFRADDAGVKRRQEYFEKQAAFERQVRAQRDRTDRFLALTRAERGLKGTTVVAATLTWPSGHPVDGSSPLSRFMDARPFGAALWFQAAGETRGQSWAGPFRDADGNGVMEFAPPEARLPAGRWTRELNFLAWKPFAGADVLELPAKAVLRVAVQWREPHDPSLAAGGADYYRTPLATVRVVLLRQLDPTGKTRAADEFEVVARSGLAARLENSPRSATYEQLVELPIETAGRYAVRVEARIPEGIRPPGVPSLPALNVGWDLRPRVFAETVDPASRKLGRPVFIDFPTTAGSLGMPAEAHGVLTIGTTAVTGDGVLPDPATAVGPPHGLDLLCKPDLFAYGIVPQGLPGAGSAGSPLSTSFAAGLAATAISNGAARLDFLPSVKVLPGGVLRLR